MKYKVALIIGRFQPFHLGHLYLLRKALTIADKIIVGIGSASILDENNPLDYETRRKIIKAVFYKEKIEEKLIKIVALEDFFDDRKWFNNVKKKVGRFDIVVSNNEWTYSIMEKAGSRVKKFSYYKRNLYEGWRIRKLVRNGKSWENRIPDYLISNFKFKIFNQFLIPNKQILNHIVLGGTFDHFHRGHRELIKTAFKFGKKVTIGIAMEELYKNKYLSEVIESFEIRKNSVSEYLNNNSWRRRGKMIVFSEFTGGADKREDIDGIVVSKMTYQNALKINERREKSGRGLLRIIIVKDVLAEDGKLLSSERIRAGEIDRNGKPFEIQNKNVKELILPEKMRKNLRKPLGRVFNSIDTVIIYINSIKPTQLIAVGDIIVDSLIKNKIDPDIKVIDFKSRRKELSIFNIQFSKNLQIPSDKYINRPGTINFKTAEKLKELIKKGNGWLIIEGEEDLLTLPAILYAHLGSLVLYGHWQFGIIAVYIDEEVKKKSKILLNRFEI